MTHVEPGPPPHMTVVTHLDLRTYPRVTYAARIALALVGLLGLIFAFAYSPHHDLADLPAGVQFVAAHLTLWFWATLWAGAGAFSLVSAFRRRVNVSATAGVLSLFAVWGFGYLITWLEADGASRAYISATAYLCIAGLLLVGSYVFNTALVLSRPPKKG